MAIASTLLSNVVTGVYTSVGSSIVTAMYFCNSGNVAVHLTVYAVPSGSSASDQNTIYYEIPLAVHDTYVIDSEKLALDNGDSIQANLLIYNSSNVKVVATVSTVGV